MKYIRLREGVAQKQQQQRTEGAPPTGYSCSRMVLGLASMGRVLGMKIKGKEMGVEEDRQVRRI